ncbi:TetR/AcrR family transcriptional regulator [Caulobacter segnis]|uniref:TetR family transcriptional regulator n=1 Tax=Caulobacter segnis TaxID=88688 RepID=A0A2W5VJ43_9CAUL|nr:TetR/AcrR family transcriptional regulator [Caulobacter segnis]PZR36696.1 MAG: TetR family transcriptional regulator [Caulobacter segnis]
MRPCLGGRIGRLGKPSGYHHGDLREALIDTAMELAERAGPESVSLRAAARAAGVSATAPYAHFDDRDALLAAACARGIGQLTTAIAACIDQAPKPQAMSAFSHAFVEFGLRRPGFYRLLFVAPYIQQAPVGCDLHRAAKAAFDLLLTLFDPDLDDDQRRRLAMRLLTGLHGLILAEQALILPDAPRVDPGGLVDDLVNALLASSRDR